MDTGLFEILQTRLKMLANFSTASQFDTKNTNELYMHMSEWSSLQCHVTNTFGMCEVSYEVSCMAFSVPVFCCGWTTIQLKYPMLDSVFPFWTKWLYI